MINNHSRPSVVICYFPIIFTSHSAKAKSCIFAAFGTVISFNASQKPNAWSPIDVIVSGDYNIIPFAGVILDRAALDFELDALF